VDYTPGNREGKQLQQRKVYRYENMMALGAAVINDVAAVF